MQSKSLLIAIAAFAVTTTGVSAYAGTDLLEKAGLSETQIEAFEEARELRESGDRDAARDVLVGAGIDEETLRNIHQAVHEARKEMKDAMHEALEADDYDAFMEAVIDSPLSDIINSKEDYDLFREAYELKMAGEFEAAKEIMSELGMEEGFGKGHGHKKGHGFGRGGLMDNLTEEQQEAIRVAREANDKETVKAILEEAGIEMPKHHHREEME